MTIVPAKNATPIVERFILALQTHMAQTPQKAPACEGQQRAADRLKAKLKANEKIPALDRPDSRQVRRRKERFAAKSKLSAAKKQAMLDKVKGGSVTIS